MAAEGRGGSGGAGWQRRGGCAPSARARVSSVTRGDGAVSSASYAFHISRSRTAPPSTSGTAQSLGSARPTSTRSLGGRVEEVEEVEKVEEAEESWRQGGCNAGAGLRRGTGRAARGGPGLG